MNVLLTGGAGYVGSVLLPKLLVRGHHVRVVDIGYFGVAHLRTLRPSIELVREDIRRIGRDPAFCREVLAGCDAIIHLAAISNDPSAELNPELTDAVNFRATAALAQAARQQGVRFLFSSSCSVYGDAVGECDEDSPVAPLTAYATSKVRAEQLLEEMSDATWRPVILRNGTLFGYSPRMRFDLVANIFSLHAALYGEIKIFGEGTQWRPFLHVADCARAFIHFLEQHATKHGRYNIASRNLRVVDLAAIVRGIVPAVGVDHVTPSDQDRRDYRVSTRRIEEEGFRARIGVETGLEELIEAITTGLIPDPESIFYRNAKWLNELTQVGSRDHTHLVSLIEMMAQARTDLL